MKLLPLAVIPLVALSLSGWTSIAFLFSTEDPNHWDDSETLFADSSLIATEGSWMPADASDIELELSTADDAAESAVIGFTSELDLIGCTTTERLSLPTFHAVWAPTTSALEAASMVQSCGDWVFVPDGDGWFGWTPSAPDEKSAT